MKKAYSFLIAMIILFGSIYSINASTAATKLSGYISYDINGESNLADISKEGFSVEISDGLYTSKTDENGYFEIDNITTGSASTTIRIKKSGYLMREINDVCLDSDYCLGTINAPVLLWPGDMQIDGYQDNAINMEDIMEAAKRFNSLKGDSRYSSQCDINNDMAVNMTDIVIIAKNFNKITANYQLCNLLKPSSNERYRDEIFSSFKIDTDIEYNVALNDFGVMQKLLLDIYTPEDDTQKERPVIIYVHGGGLTGGSKEEDKISGFMTMKGYVVVNINYRLTNDDPYSDFNRFNHAMNNAMTDVVSAIDWVKANSYKYGIDKNKIFIAGYSAGAEMITNLVYGTFVDGWDRTGIKGVVDISGNRLFWGDAYKTDTPCLIIHGTADQLNPYSDVLKLVDQFKAGNIKYELLAIEGEGHYYGLLPNSYLDLQKAVTDFLYKIVTG